MPIIFVPGTSAVKKYRYFCSRRLAFLYWAPCVNLKKTKKANGKISTDHYFWPSSDNKSGIVRDIMKDLVL